MVCTTNHRIWLEQGFAYIRERDIFMFKSLRKNSVIPLAFLVGIFGNSLPLHAAWQGNLPQIAEVATALIRGACSKLECDLKQDDSKSAHLKRLLISILRITHGVVAIH